MFGCGHASTVYRDSVAGKILQNVWDRIAPAASLFLNRQLVPAWTHAENRDSLIDPVTLSEIWDVHADRLLLIARSIDSAAEDAVQEAFVALACQPELPEDPLAWLVRVTRNQLLQWQRGKRRREARETQHPAPNWFDCDILRVQRQLDATEVTRALQGLESPDREIIVMHLWGEMTFDAISEVIGSSKASTHRAYQRGLSQLKKQFPSSTEPDHARFSNEQR